MDEIIKWCITGACALLPAITIYLVVNVLSWKSKKKVVNKNEIAQPRQYFWIFVGSTVLWSAMSLFALFLPEEMDANDSSLLDFWWAIAKNKSSDDNQNDEIH